MADSSSKKIKVDDKNDTGKAEVKGDIIIKKSYVSLSSPWTNPILPPETWDQIFRGFSSTDFISVINAAPEWNELLGSRKTAELFPKVFPHLLPYLNTTDVLTCRQVAKSWKEGAEQIIQSIWTSSDTWFDFHYRKTNNVYSIVERISKAYVFGYTQKLELTKFVRALSLQDEETVEDENATTNPFLTRSLEIDRREWQEGRVQKCFFSNIETTLSHYGNCILRLKYIAKDFPCVSYLSSYLKHLPHLKILELSCEFFQNWPTVAYTNYFRRITDLPPLPELECLNATFLKEHSLATFFVETYGPQLTTLTVNARSLKSPGMKIGDLNSRLSKLKKLRVYDDGSGGVSLLSQIRFPLETLQIHLFTSKPSDIQRILEKVCSFKDTLICLQLQLDREYYMDLALETDDDDKTTRFTAFNERDFTALAKLAFEKLPKLDKVVFWIKKEHGKLVQYIKNRQTFEIN